MLTNNTHCTLMSNSCKWFYLLHELKAAKTEMHTVLSLINNCRKHTAQMRRLLPN